MNVFEEIRQRLEDYKVKGYTTGITNDPFELGACNAVDKAKAIVSQVEREYGNGWIACNDSPPKEDGRYLVTVRNLTGRKILENNVFVCEYCGEFIFEGWEDNEVLAWHYLPKPYKKER